MARRVLYTNEVVIGYAQKSVLGRVRVSVLAQEGVRFVAFTDEYRKRAKPEWSRGKNRIQIPIETPTGLKTVQGVLKLLGIPDHILPESFNIPLDEPSNYVYIGEDD